MLIEQPLFYFIAVPAVLLAGISKGGFGGGLGSMAVPLMALAVSPLQAAAVMLPLLCVMDLFGVWAYRGQWDHRNMAILVPGALLGIGIGAATFRYLGADHVRLIIGAIATVFAGRWWLRRRGGQPAPRPGGVARGLLWGTVSGFCSFVAHAGGPPVGIYLLPQRMARTLYVGTTVFFFITVNYVKLVPYAFIGQFSDDNVLTSLVLMPVAVLGMRLGIGLHRMVSEQAFYLVCYTLMLVTGVKLLWDGGRGLLG